MTGVPLEHSLPREAYVSAERFETEASEVLWQSWFCAGRSESLPARGDYLTVDVMGESLLLVNTGENLVAHVNLCRHRGSRLVPPAGRLPPASPGPTGRLEKQIRCPYHGWAYGLDGALRAAPCRPEVREHRDCLSLHQVEVATWGGFVFVRLRRPEGPHPPSLAEALGGADERLSNYGLSELRVGHRIVYEVAANWKVILENYNECYHCGPVHPELCELVPAFRRGGAGLDWEAGIPHREGAYSFTSSGTTERAPIPGLSEGERLRHKGELVLPNLMLSCSSDHVAAFILWPRSAGSTSLTCDFLFHPDEIARPSFDPSDAVELWDVVNRQDWWICEQVQDGMGSRWFSFGYLSPMEQPSADVGRYVTERLGRR